MAKQIELVNKYTSLSSYYIIDLLNKGFKPFGIIIAYNDSKEDVK